MLIALYLDVHKGIDPHTPNRPIASIAQHNSSLGVILEYFKINRCR